MPATTEALSDYEKERGKPLPSFNHGTIQAILINALFEYRSEFSVVSELSLELPLEKTEADGDRVARTNVLRVTPDISIYPKKEIDWMRDEVRMSEPPLLVVLVANPSQPQQDVMDEIRDLLGAGVQSCWFVVPAIRGITVFTEGAESRTVTEGVLEDPATGIEIDVVALFAQG